MSERWAFLDLDLPDYPVVSVDKRWSVLDLDLSTTEPLVQQPRMAHSAPEATGSVLEAPHGLEALWAALAAYNGDYRAEIQCVVRGQSFAEPGSRNDMMARLAGVIAWMPEARGQAPERLAEILRPSLAVWAAEPDAKKNLDEEITVALGVLRSSQSKLADFLAEERIALTPLARAVRLGQATADTVPPEALSNEFIKKCAIITQGKWLRVFNFKRNEYGYQITRDDLIVICRDYWNGSAPDPIDMYYEDDKGRTKTKQIAKIIEEYGTAVKEIICDMTLDESYFDAATETFHEAIAKPRIEEIEFDQQFDEYLRVATGVNYELFCDWLASLVQIERPTCAVYLIGGPDAGKTMLAGGIARIWSDKSLTNFEHAMGGFNAQLTRSPLLFCDEGLTDQARRNLSTRFREIVGSRIHEIRDKYSNVPRTLKGCIRVLLCANNDRLLDFDNTGVDDQKALAERILYVPLSDEGVTWLRAHHGITDRWVEGDGIARHCLWLAVNREISASSRFLVTGSESVMHRKLATSGESESDVAEFLTEYSMNPKKIYMNTKKNGKPLLAIGHNKLFVKTRGVLEYWKMYLPDRKKPSQNTISRILKKFSHGRVQPDEFGRTRYDSIRVDVLLEWCEEEENVLENLRKEEWQ